MADIYANYGDGSTTGYYAVAKWAALTLYSVGNIVRQLAVPAVNGERCFRCSVAGTSGAAEPTWVTAQGGTTSADGTVTWVEVTGQSTYNWSAPHARLTQACNWTAVGDNIWVGHNHAELLSSGTGITITPQNSAVSPSKIMCVNTAGSIPPVSADLRTTATITQGGVAALTINGSSTYFYGISFITTAGGGTTVLNSSVSKQVFEKCVFANSVNSASNIVKLGANTNTEWIDCTYTTGNSGQSLQCNGSLFLWRGTGSSCTGTAATTFITTSLGGVGMIILDGVDISNQGSHNLCVLNASRTFVRFLNCKMPASFAIPNPTNAGGGRIYVENSDSAATNYRYEVRDTFGTLTTETVVIKTSPAGASDGTTPVSHKIVSTANCNGLSPFESDILVWCAAGARTVTLECITDNVVLTNADIYAEVSYLGNASYPQASRATSGVADQLTAGSNLTTSSATWTTTGLTTPKPQSFSVSFTTQFTGYVRIKVKMAKASTTTWLDPYPTVT